MSVRLAKQPYLGRNPGTSLDYLREKVADLEGEREERIRILESMMQQGSGGVDGRDAIDPDEERQVAKRNAFLRRELARMQLAERQHATDPRVKEKRNQIRDVKRQIEQVESEIATLRVMKKRRDRGLRAIEWGEENARRVRNENAEVNAELRLTLKELTDELKEIEKKDKEAHERCARLQEMVKLGATTDEVEQLESNIAQQKEEIEQLKAKEAEWKRVKAGVRTENRKMINAEEKEIKRLNLELSKLHVVLSHRDHELRAAFRNVGNAKLVAS